MAIIQMYGFLPFKSGKKQNKSSSSVLPACNKSRARKYIGAIFKQERSQILEPFLFIHLIMF